LEAVPPARRQIVPRSARTRSGALHTNLLNEAEHGSYEGASIRKRNGIYYLVYADISRRRPTCLDYAANQSPLDPFNKRGIIIDNIGCNPETWNTHCSIAEFNGQCMFSITAPHRRATSIAVCASNLSASMQMAALTK